MIGVASVKGRPTWRRLGPRPRGPRPRRAGPGGRDGRGAHARLRRRPIAGRPGRRRGRPLPPVRVAARRLPGRSARARRPAHRLHRRPVTGRVPGPRRARALRSPRARVRPRLRVQRTCTAAPDRYRANPQVMTTAVTAGAPVRCANRAPTCFLAVGGSGGPRNRSRTEPLRYKKFRDVLLIRPQENGWCCDACPFRPVLFARPFRPGITTASAGKHSIPIEYRNRSTSRWTFPWQLDTAPTFGRQYDRRIGGGIRPRVSDWPTISPGTRQRGEGRNVRGQLVAVKRYTFARIRFFRSSSFTSLARA